MTDQTGSHGRRRCWWLVLLGLLVFTAGGGTAWAVLTVLRPAEDPSQALDHTYVRVVRGEVSASFPMNTLAQWTPTPVGVNRASGVVTGVVLESGAEVGPGAVLYTVDLRPVTVAVGDTPAFRDLGWGMRGPDVSQLQSMLTAVGHYTGDIDGEVGARTERAICAWQKSLGVEQTGVVGAGDVVFVPRLPARLSLDGKVVKPGASLTGGEEVVFGLPDSPVFTIPVTDAQAAMIPAGTMVEVASPSGGVWAAVAQDQRQDPDTGSVVVTVTGADGAPLCAQECASIPLTGRTPLRSSVVTVAPVTGLVVPSAALTTGADNRVAVITESGELLPVVVVASAKGMSVVTGVAEGQRVRIPA